MQNQIYIVDAMNYIFRAYHALPDSIAAPSGMPTNAVLGYIRTLLRIIKERKPGYLVSAFEGGSSFRRDLFAGYKANRSAAPEDLQRQLPYCRAMSDAIGVACVEHHGYEADDVIGTIAVRMRDLGYSVVIVTGDKDMSQLVREGIQIYDIARESWLDESAVRNKFGVTPGQIPDLLALLGDSVDNIPGVFGVGDKTARQILAVYSGLDDLVSGPSVDDQFTFRGRIDILRRIREGIDAVRLSRTLATICCDAPIAITPDLLRYRRGHIEQLRPLCDELGLRRLLDDIPVSQPSLF